ncbi:uncharacterized protein A1O5_13468, partial [Cladophialophora psammophila CBS 110553]
IAIIIGYNAQYRLYLYIKTKLIYTDNKYSTLVVIIIDKYQGMKFNVIIIDFLVIDTPGFLAKYARVNVRISRVRFVLYVLDNKE